MKSVRPVVIGNLSVVFLHGDQKPDHCFIFKSSQSKQVNKHEQGLSYFQRIIQVESIERKPKVISMLLYYVILIYDV